MATDPENNPANHSSADPQQQVHQSFTEAENVQNALAVLSKQAGVTLTMESLAKLTNPAQYTAAEIEAVKREEELAVVEEFSKLTGLEPDDYFTLKTELKLSDQELAIKSFRNYLTKNFPNLDEDQINNEINREFAIDQETMTFLPHQIRLGESKIANMAKMARDEMQKPIELAKRNIENKLMSQRRESEARNLLVQTKGVFMDSETEYNIPQERQPDVVEFISNFDKRIRALVSDEVTTTNGVTQVENPHKKALLAAKLLTKPSSSAPSTQPNMDLYITKEEANALIMEANRKGREGRMFQLPQVANPSPDATRQVTSGDVIVKDGKTYRKLQ